MKTRTKSFFIADSMSKYGTILTLITNISWFKRLNSRLIQLLSGHNFSASNRHLNKINKIDLCNELTRMTECSVDTRETFL